jgi:hypothetical protein
MYPILFQYKLISIGGYGIMLGLGFYLAFLLFERELKIRGLDPEMAYKILLVAIPSGVGYNMLQGTVRRSVIEMEGFVDELTGRIACEFQGKGD